VHVLVEELAQSEMIGQRRWLDQPGIGDGMVVIEGHQKSGPGCAKMSASK